jgi:NAD(P)-dependent dehydrogenase (short-subunit alcohol dehydrogenase family)
VHDQDAMDSAAASALSAFRSIDIVCANAGVVAGGPSWRRKEPRSRKQVATPTLAGQHACSCRMSLTNYPVPVRCSGSAPSNFSQKSAFRPSPAASK